MSLSSFLQFSQCWWSHSRWTD